MGLLSGIRELWALTLGDPAICIAVLDGPVDLSHPSSKSANLTQVGSLMARLPDEASIPADFDPDAITDLNRDAITDFNRDAVTDLDHRPAPFRIRVRRPARTATADYDPDATDGLVHSSGVAVANTEEPSQSTGGRKGNTLRRITDVALKASR
jgi:hypothetical protein